MKKLLLGCVALAALASPSIAGTFGNNYNVEIVNNSSYTVYRLYATNRDDSGWGYDRLPNVINPGESTVLDLDDYSGYCKYDLRAETEDGSTEWVKYNVDVCSAADWTLVD